MLGKWRDRKLLSHSREGVRAEGPPNAREQLHREGELLKHCRTLDKSI